MKTNIIIAIAGVITLVFFLCVPEGNVPVSILFGFSAVGIGSTIKFIILNVPKIMKQLDNIGGGNADACHSPLVTKFYLPLLTAHCSLLTKKAALAAA